MQSLTDDEYTEIECLVFEYLYDELTNNPLQYATPSFYENMVYELSDLLLNQWYEDNDEDEVHYFMFMIIMTFFQVFDEFPHRSYVEYNEHLNIRALGDQIQLLRTMEQPRQKTTEWYVYRNNLLTASNIWKAFGSECQVNSLIYEKCRGHFDRRIFNGSIQWGNIFEPLSVKIYEIKNGTIVEDFGCIQHPNYHYIGASPDGINVDPESEKFGRMLEVKNIYNREITGIPKEEYWIQMQIQMETCNLDICDFLETRFTEFDSEDDYYESSHEYKGTILSFANDSEPDLKYLYKPLKMHDKDDIDDWIAEQCVTMSDNGYMHVRTIYWFLEEYSCVTVTRNYQWFSKAQPVIENIYNIIQLEKRTGFEHRAPKKTRKPTITITHDSSQNPIIHNIETSPKINIIKKDDGM